MFVIACCISWTTEQEMEEKIMIKEKRYFERVGFMEIVPSVSFGPDDSFPSFLSQGNLRIFRKT
jgi:hypothetical protein